MAERMGANGLPIQKKIVTWEDVQAESTDTLQEILEVNPTAYFSSSSRSRVRRRNRRRTVKPFGFSRRTRNTRLFASVQFF